MDSEDLLHLLQGAHLDERVALEQKAVKATGLDGRGARLDRAVQDVVKAWTVAAGGPRTDLADAGALAKIIALVKGHINGALGGLGSAAYSSVVGLLPRAQTLGQGQAMEAWRGQGGGPLGAVAKALGIGSLGKDAGALGRDVGTWQRAALAMLRPELLKSLGLPAALAPLQRARGALDLVRSGISRLVGAAMERGAAKVAEAADAPFEVWVAERDACARCQALSGHVVAAGQSFPGGLSLDPAQVVKGAKAVKPPLHPHCRCKLVPYDPANHPPGAVTLPEAARREALRSAVRGFSLPSESNASRLRAAEFAIQQARPGDLPKSVIAYGRSAVRQGRFPRGRDVPNGPAS